MTATARPRQAAESDLSARCRPGGRHLQLVQYQPVGDDPVVCAALWREDDHVHLASPLLPTRRGVRDPQAYVRQFPQGMASIDAFEDAMTWLDAACFAATDPRDVESACEAHPEWQLRCVRYDGSDAALSGLNGLIHAAERAGRLPTPVLRDCLLELIDQILKHEPQLAGAQIQATYHDGADLATLEIGADCVVRVTLLPDLETTDTFRQGRLAHPPLTEHGERPVRCLLVAPALQIDRPMFMTPRVAITGMEPEQLRAALLHLTQEPGRR